MVRKYLPPGTLYELFQFYSGWCATHNVQDKASWLEFHLSKMLNHFLELGFDFFLNIWDHSMGGIWLGKGMLPSCVGGMLNGHLC